ncbi:type IX secretion system membrane protein PorP/SprF [Mariniflexile litorale]|uniref:Type IX secretion system membrane protein PorP/SprF n=1 Tax=Mariniflexile litorale TaxID=3045158 RepID=A0AAU7E9F3_9FLAO|nr:type IX secretion system membrane protein PorP/SprF [Mariniflexile sp. KMM 9835]MDQ8210454.1 type IX secretion system membrane protein PorP/SprF [Mariniflexile sp. KMM 9835]
MKIKIFVVFITCGLFAYAQQEPHYTQYMYNMSMVNAGYMMNEPGIVQVGSLYRTQWVGIDGAPKTANLFANIPLSEKIELGVNYLNDNIGGNINLSENVFNLNAAYKINLKNDLNLSFGIKMGFDHLNFSSLGSNVSADPLFQNSNKTVVNIGAGVFLFHEKYYVGLSSPNLIPSDFDINSDVLYEEASHAFLIGGYVFDINSEFKLKPSTVVKYVGGSPLSFDLSANMLYMNRFELGVSYRYEDAVAGLMGIHITPNLKVGYAYDFNTSKLKTYNNGSHEFIVLYKFDVLGLSKKYSSPRFY